MENVNVKSLNKFIRKCFEVENKSLWRKHYKGYVGAFERQNNTRVRFWFDNDGVCVAHGNTDDKVVIIDPKIDKPFAKALFSYAKNEGYSMFTSDHRRLEFPCVFSVDLDNDCIIQNSAYFDDGRYCIVVADIDEYCDFLAVVEYYEEPARDFNGYGNANIFSEHITSYDMLDPVEVAVAERRRQKIEGLSNQVSEKFKDVITPDKDIYLIPCEDATWQAVLSVENIEEGARLVTEGEYPVQLYYYRTDLNGSSMLEMDLCENSVELMSSLNWCGQCGYSLRKLWEFDIDNGYTEKLGEIFLNASEMRRKAASLDWAICEALEQNPSEVKCFDEPSSRDDLPF